MVALELGRFLCQKREKAWKVLFYAFVGFFFFIFLLLGGGAWGVAGK